MEPVGQLGLRVMHPIFAPAEHTLPHPEDLDQHETPQIKERTGHKRRLLQKLGFAFFVFGLFNNVLYVIILSAALDLVPPATPKGIIAFCNIAPALVAKVGWPYFLKGKIRYTRRLIGCCVMSFLGMIVVAIFNKLYMRLLGICLASFSSGLGELTFLQLSTTYSPSSIAGHSVGYFASGTGAAGLVGAFLWWEMRSLGIRTGVGLSSILPFVIPLTYFFLLPRSSAFLYSPPNSTYQEISDPIPTTSFSYTPLATTEEGGEEEGSPPSGPKRGVALSAGDKWRIVKPLLKRYMLPLFFVYMFEYTINQGIGPTLIYPVPSAEGHWLLSKFIHSIRDYYPLWQLVYQTTVFLSRSAISLGIPVLPVRLIPLPAIIQSFIFLTLMYESAIGIFGDESESLSIFLVFTLISLEGLCGGLSYVTVFYRVNQESPDPETCHNIEKSRQEREFKIGSLGFADSTGILLASILAVPTEIELCKAQLRRGKMFCKDL